MTPARHRKASLPDRTDTLRQQTRRQVHRRRSKDFDSREETMTLCIGLSPSDLGGLHRTHLLRPSLRRLELLHRTDFVRSISRHANVVVAFQNELNIAYLEGRGVAQLGETTGARNDLIDEVICYLKDGLERKVSRALYGQNIGAGQKGSLVADCK